MLDPNRFALNAETVGFRRRMKQPVNMEAFSRALQTETDTVKVRRELQETPISEVHTMGAQLYGFAGNAKSNEMERQQRQINGYPLREWQHGTGPIVLPVKRSESSLALPMNQGLVQYTQYNATVGNYVSKFAEPNPDHVFGTVQDGTEHNVTMSQAFEERRQNVRNWQEERSRVMQNRKVARINGNADPYGPDLQQLQGADVARASLMGQIRGLGQGAPPAGNGNGGNNVVQPAALNQNFVAQQRAEAASKIGSAILRFRNPKKPVQTPTKTAQNAYATSQIVNNVPQMQAQAIINSQLGIPIQPPSLAYGSSPNPGQASVATTPSLLQRLTSPFTTSPAKVAPYTGRPSGVSALTPQSISDIFVDPNVTQRRKSSFIPKLNKK
jgi:hypothetical protein